jgi:hypothetical protein
MSIQHGTAHTSYSTKAPGYDLRDTAVGGAIRRGSPEAVERFRQILAARDVVKASRPVTEESMEATTSDNGTAVVVVDNSASRKFEAARKRPKDPKPVTIEQAAAKRPRKKQVKLTDDQARQAHTEYWHSLDTLEAVCKQWNVSESALRKRWQKLGLPLAGQGTNRYLRQPKTAVIPAAPKQPETAVVPVLESAAGFIPADFLANVRAFREEMEAIGVPVQISMSLHLVKEVQL